MLRTEDMVMILSNALIRSNKNAVSKAPMQIATEQAAALGMTKRNLLRFVKIAIQAISDKLEVQSITLKDTQSTDTVKQWLYTDNHFNKLEKSIYKAVVRDGITYVLVAYKDNSPVLTQVDSFDGDCGVFTVKNTVTNTPEYRVNVWYAGKEQYVDVYYPDRIEKYYYDSDDGQWKSRKDTPNESFPIPWVALNGEPLGIALVAFDIDESDITESVQLQADMNEVYLDMLATSRTMGWPQRVLKNASQETYLLNQYQQPLIFGTSGSPIPREIKLTPGSILMLQGNESDLTQLSAADVNTTAIDKIEQLISQMTTVPNHYFGGEWPSGVALVNAETRLNHKVESHQAYLTPSMQQTISLMISVSNTYGNTSLDSTVFIDILWYSPVVETTDLRLEIEKAKVDNATAMFNAGYLSVEDALRYSFPDKTDEEIAAMVARTQEGNQIVGLGATLA